ncbi:SNF2 domain-containing protein/helicase domain-containing protein [Abeliophyllum distichum]|uniref:SNF2 domain-containing protein/helicase domain-containing protein n=1 Tax=Abeliophyllum distichum TaxID=126358 RepID=A0ABD1VZ52_9LAMI
MILKPQLRFSQYLLPLKFLKRLTVKMNGYRLGNEMFMITCDSDSETQESWTDSTLHLMLKSSLVRLKHVLKKLYAYRLIAFGSPEEENHKTCFKKESVAKMWFEWDEHGGRQNFEMKTLDVKDCGDLFLETRHRCFIPEITAQEWAVFILLRSCFGMGRRRGFCNRGLGQQWPMRERPKAFATAEWAGDEWPRFRASSIAIRAKKNRDLGAFPTTGGCG